MMNKEAIRIILNECECVNRECGIEKSCSKCDLVMPSKEPILQAYEMAIQALSQEPCEDAEQIDYHDDFETTMRGREMKEWQYPYLTHTKKVTKVQ